jgi:hypothetical protein
VTSPCPPAAFAAGRRAAAFAPDRAFGFDFGFDFAFAFEGALLAVFFFAVFFAARFFFAAIGCLTPSSCAEPAG